VGDPQQCGCGGDNGRSDKEGAGIKGGASAGIRIEHHQGAALTAGGAWPFEGKQRRERESERERESNGRGKKGEGGENMTSGIHCFGECWFIHLLEDIMPS
jgi:hypothetical protein